MDSLAAIQIGKQLLQENGYEHWTVRYSPNTEGKLCRLYPKTKCLLLNKKIVLDTPYFGVEQIIKKEIKGNES